MTPSRSDSWTCGICGQQIIGKYLYLYPIPDSKQHRANDGCKAHVGCALEAYAKQAAEIEKVTS
jgi:hypothetical protein